MIYLSKGLLSRRSGKTLIVSHCGIDYLLKGDQALLWENGHHGPYATENPEQEQFILELASDGLSEYGSEAGDAAIFRLLINCVICACARKSFFAALPLLSKTERELWKWIRFAGLRLTVAELVFLAENGVKPERELLGDENRQALTEVIYTPETIYDGILESRMENAAARDKTVKAILGLLSKNRIFLV